MKGLSGRLPILIFLGRRETEKPPLETLVLGRRRRQVQTERRGGGAQSNTGLIFDSRKQSTCVTLPSLVLLLSDCRLQTKKKKIIIYLIYHRCKRGENQLVWSRFHRCLKIHCAHSSGYGTELLLFTQGLRKRREFLTKPNHLPFPSIQKTTDTDKRRVQN